MRSPRGWAATEQHCGRRGRHAHPYHCVDALRRTA